MVGMPAEESADTRAALKKPNPAKFDSYDDYLDAFVTGEDLQYLDHDTARQIHQHLPPEHQLVITRAAYDASRTQAQAEREAALAALRLASEGCDVSGNLLLKVMPYMTLHRCCLTLGSSTYGFEHQAPGNRPHHCWSQTNVQPSALARALCLLEGLAWTMLRSIAVTDEHARQLYMPEGLHWSTCSGNVNLSRKCDHAAHRACSGCQGKVALVRTISNSPSKYSSCRLCAASPSPRLCRSVYGACC